MKRYVPRWLYSRKQKVPSESFIEIDSTIFRNDTIWPMKLEWMSLVSLGDNLPIWGGSSHRMHMEMSISRKGPMFPVPQSMSALFTPGVSPRLNCATNSMSVGAGFTFDKEVIIPPNTGIVAEVANQAPVNDPEYKWYNPSAIFKCVEEDYNSPEKNPVILADRWPDQLNQGSSKVLRGAGLKNNGLKDVAVRHMNLSSGGYWGSSYDSFDLSLTYSLLEWRINPTTGVQWMPDPSTIPVGAIAPYNRSYRDDEHVGPRVMEFADNIYMEPTQQLELGVYSEYTTDVSLGLCLFGYLEVE